MSCAASPAKLAGQPPEVFAQFNHPLPVDWGGQGDFDGFPFFPPVANKMRLIENVEMRFRASQSFPGDAGFRPRLDIVYGEPHTTTPTPMPTATPSATPSPTPEPTSIATPEPSPTSEPTATPTATPAPTQTPAPRLIFLPLVSARDGLNGP